MSWYESFGVALFSYVNPLGQNLSVPKSNFKYAIKFGYNKAFPPKYLFVQLLSAD